MPIADLFTRDLWDSVADELEGAAESWWFDNRDDLLSLAKEEAEDILQALRDGNNLRAKMEIVGHMDREEWRAYRRATTAQLQGIAARRHRLIRAIEELITATAKAIGTAAGKALGF